MRNPSYPDGQKIAFHAALGDAIRSHREARRLSRAQLGVATGVSSSMLGKIESGEAACPSYLVACLARTLGCTTDALLMVETAA